MNIKLVLLDAGTILVSTGIMLFSFAMFCSMVANTIEDIELMVY